MTWGEGRRKLGSGLTVLALCASLLSLVPGSAGVAKAELNLIPDETWGVVGLYESLTTNTAAEVMAIEQIGNTVYVGGQFLEVVRRRSEPRHDQPFLAAFDATTGDWIDWWRPSLDGGVFALEAAPDGSRLYVGGDFSMVNGIGDTAGLVALDPATGEVDADFFANVQGASTGRGVVRTIRAIDDSLYVGGSFNYITGPDPSSRTRLYRLGRLSAVDGTPDPTWQPLVTGGSVWGLDVDPSRDRVYLAGHFQAIDGAPETDDFAVVRISDGTPFTDLERYPQLSLGQAHTFEVLVDGDSVWVGGAQHVLHKLAAEDLSIERRWFTGFAEGWQIGGDFQSIGMLGDRIYASCHCWGVIRELPEWVTTLNEARNLEPIAGEINGIMAFDRTTGDWIPAFNPDLYGPLGGWALHGAADGCLWAGGDFNRRPVGDQFSNGLVRFCDEAGQGPAAGPPLQPPPDTSESNPPTRPLHPAVADGPGDDIIFSWTESGDDTAVATYVIYRDGVEEGRTRRTQFQLTPGGALSVRAVDPSGNFSQFSDPVATIPLNPEVLGHWPLDGSALDMSGNDNHGTMSGTFNTPGVIIDAQQLEIGDSIEVAPNPQLRIGAANGDFTISTWLRLDSDATGVARDNLTAAGVAVLGTAADSRRVRAAITTSTGSVEVLSAGELSVGDWAHVALTRETDQVNLYVDGALEGTAPLTGTTSAGSGAIEMTGDTATLDDVVIHAAALSPSQVADQAAPPHPDALWAHYSMEGDAIDASGNGFDGTVVGAEPEPAPVGLGLRFDGTDQVIIPNDPGLRPGENGGDFSVSFWMNLQEGFSGERRVIVQKGADETQQTFTMMMHDDTNRIRFRLSTDVSTSNGSNSVSSLTIGEWTHITYVKRGGALSLFLNGELDASRNIVGTVLANDGDIYIGNTPWFEGTAMVMDDFRIYSYGLMPDEVRALAGTTTPPAEPPAPLPPAAAIVDPTAGTEVNGVVEVAVEATSAVDALGTLDVEVGTGAAWQTATWNAAAGSYNYLWDTTTSPLGPTSLQARATDSNGNTTNAPPVELDVVATPVEYDSLVNADGAVAYWKLDDGGGYAYDSIDQTHKARFVGPTTLTAPLLPEGGRSSTFDGDDDMIRVADHVDINTANTYPQRSVELWFNANDAGRRQVLWEEGGSKVGISLYLRNGKIHAGAWDRTSGGWADDVFVAAPFQAGEVYHVVLTISDDNGRLRLWLNGEKVAQASGVDALSSHPANIGLGARRGSTRFADKAKSGGNGNWLDGVIDNVAIYNTALTKSQIQAHYGAGLD